jgi:hypothetical protein
MDGIPAARRSVPRRSSRSARLHLEVLEERRLLNGDYRTYDGSNNNLANPNWGKAGINLLRIAAVDYGDGYSTPAGADRLSARAISNGVNVQAPVTKTNDRLMSDFAYIFGQFINHDISFTDSNPAEPFNIPVPCGDPYFDPFNTCTKTIKMSRSNYDPATGTGSGNPRQQYNKITAWLDGSVIYGSDATRAAALRTFSGGKLKTSAGNLLPLNTDGLPNQNQGPYPSNQLFLAGDERANENAELTALHTLFVREHNYWAELIGLDDPLLNDEAIYQTARKIVGAELQAITYNEFLPALLGDGALKPYAGYQPNVNPGVANEFSTVGFRVGHSMLRENIKFLGNDGRPIAPDMSLAEVFFNPSVLKTYGIDPLIKYLGTDNASEVDTRIIDAVRNFLFGPPGAGGFDLASLDIQRARDHGIPDYNALRAAYGLDPVFAFNQITTNTSLQSKLKQLYNFDVNNVDPWIGALAETHLPGASVGPLMQRIIAEQFERIRDGDRYWYELTFTRAEQEWLNQQTFADIIRRNSGISNIQDQVFIYEVAINGSAFNDVNGNKIYDAGEPWLVGWTVELRNPSGALLATAITNSQGWYQFDNQVPPGDDSPYFGPGGGDAGPETQDGLSIGYYNIRLKRQRGWMQTTPNPATIDISKGMIVSGIDFGSMQLSTTLRAVSPLTPASARSWSSSSERIITRGSNSAPAATVRSSVVETSTQSDQTDQRDAITTRRMSRIAAQPIALFDDKLTLS